MPNLGIISVGMVVKGCHRLMVDVAQSVEPRIVAPVVVGSNPIVHPI